MALAGIAVFSKRRIRFALLLAVIALMLIPILKSLHPSEGRWAAITALARRTSVVLMGRTGEPLARFEPSGIRSSLGRLAYSPDGRLLAVLAGRAIHLLAGDTLQPVAELTRFTKQVNALAFSNDSRTLLSASHDGAVRLWDVASGTVRTAYDWRIGPVTALAFSTDGLLGATASNKGSIVIWDVAE